MMQIVIRIDEKLYNDMKSLPFTTFAEDIIINGTPLPKDHGDLVDISPYKGKVICSHLYSGVKKLIEVDSIKPIIEAESEDEE